MVTPGSHRAAALLTSTRCLTGCLSEHVALVAEGGNMSPHEGRLQVNDLTLTT